ncbi:MAG: glycosyltransferase family 2 protein, partial [Nitrospira sp.]|nr:glycosyltransferase family 2 protein [Nitrospira sp.]
MVTIIIVNWNAGSLLADCLLSIAQFGGNHVAKVVVIDNGSTDGSVEAIERLGIPTLEIIRNRENAGFASACNQGAKLAATPHLLFLNPDARLLDSTLATACACLDSSSMSSVGILGTQLIDSSAHVSRTCSRHPTAIGIVARSLGVDRIFASQTHFLLDWDHSATRLVDQVIGACYLVRADVFAQLGGFDERFFVYFEEVDFAVRASQRGWRTVYCADATAFHLGGGTSRQAKPQRLFYSLR